MNIRAAVLAALVALPQGLAAQAAMPDGLLDDVRRAAALAPGDLPLAVRVVTLGRITAPLARMVEGGAADTTVIGGYPVFQVRYPHGWVMVDAAMDRAFFRDSTTFSQTTYDSIQLALRDARLVVITHEHHDHVAGVLRSPYLAQIRGHTLLTREQVRTLMEHPSSPMVRIDSATAAGYLVNSYEGFEPVAPGVVLIKTPGHTPGSQLVYVRLASGQEIIIAGDVAWNMRGITRQALLPEATSRALGEDRAAIPAQLAWVDRVSRQGPVIVVSHDQAWIDTLLSRGVLLPGLDLSNP